ncbi:hypothetical protein M9H77_07584 [Catharanthus roseus]|uniref:Uncharacterized protein n=1 Tax=Catharanthus roseus TaxID=4058 RepID=A0ACC0BVM3_CATRO|nr:hypothetical protein M9H77_00424 [Catharanthus roseus]KAI5676634.1 hypothetical protein M9H77_07584 [Catharanthus roseus]
MPSDQFVWFPYHDRGLVPSDLWRSEVPLICYEIVEYHYSGRLRENDHTYWGTQHANYVEVWHQWRLHIRDGLALAVEVLSYLNDKYIRWYREITRVYIGNLANRNTRSVGYRLAGVAIQMMTSMLHEVADMASVPSRRRPREPLPDRGARGVKRGARRLPGRGARDGHPPIPPFPGKLGHADPGHEVERDEGSEGGLPPIDPY